MVVLTFPFFSFPMKLSTQQSRNHFCKALDISTSTVDFIAEVYSFLTFLPSLYSQKVFCFSPLTGDFSSIRHGESNRSFQKLA